MSNVSTPTKKTAQILKSKKSFVTSNKNLNVLNSNNKLTTCNPQSTSENTNLNQNKNQTKPQINDTTNPLNVSPISKFYETSSNLVKTLKLPLDLHAKKSSLCLNNFRNITTSNFNLPNLDEIERRLNKTNLSSNSINTFNTSTSLIVPKQKKQLNNSNNRSINTTNINISFIKQEKEKENKDIFKVLETKLDDLLNTGEVMDEKKNFMVNYLKN